MPILDKKYYEDMQIECNIANSLLQNYYIDITNERYS
jgi:hypothetical protein